MHTITIVSPDFVQHTDSVLASAGFLHRLEPCSVSEDQMLVVLIVHILYSNESIHYQILLTRSPGGLQIIPDGFKEFPQPKQTEVRRAKIQDIQNKCIWSWTWIRWPKVWLGWVVRCAKTLTWWVH